MNESGFGEASQLGGDDFQYNPRGSSHMQDGTKLNSYKVLKELNKELGKKQIQVQQDCTELSEKVKRMNENLQNIKYAEANETKGNITANQFNRYEVYSSTEMFPRSRGWMGSFSSFNNRRKC